MQLSEVVVMTSLLHRVAESPAAAAAAQVEAVELTDLLHLLLQRPQ